MRTALTLLSSALLLALPIAWGQEAPPSTYLTNVTVPVSDRTPYNAENYMSVTMPVDQPLDIVIDQEEEVAGVIDVPRQPSPEEQAQQQAQECWGNVYEQTRDPMAATAICRAGPGGNTVSETQSDSAACYAGLNAGPWWAGAITCAIAYLT